MMRVVIAASLGVVGLSMVGAAGCADDAFCYTCGSDHQGWEPRSDTGTDGTVLVEGGVDALLNPDGGEGGIQCPAGKGDCNLVAADGCESYLDSDPKNCGACGNNCALAHAQSECQQGTCSIKQCANGWTDCDNKPDNGCESDTSKDPVNCGECGAACAAVPNAHPVCADSKCDGYVCEKGYADCNSDSSDGCEIDLLRDPKNCGACEHACGAVAHGKSACGEGFCEVGVCDQGWDNCDQSFWSGCETELATTTDHCGFCGNKCQNLAHGIPKCSQSKCVVDACDPGFDDCDNVPTNGCEVDLASDPKNCGLCENPCPTMPHSKPVCNMFQCEVGDCDSGWMDCYGGAADGCETDIYSDADHCGSCSGACDPVVDGHRTCKQGKCAIESCDDNFADCNGHLLDGCEIDLRNSAQHCGACQKACQALPHATPMCEDKTCTLSACEPGYADCDTIQTNGCEHDTTTDWQNCGACGAVCGSKHCENGACVCVKSLLVIGDESASGTATLTGALTTLLGSAWTVTTATKPSYQYDGASPAPAGFGAILLLAGGPGAPSYSTDMPTAGQQAIVDFVTQANGLVLTEWAAKHVADGRWQTLKDLVLLTRTVAFSGQVTYSLDPGFLGHPLWTGLQTSFTFASTSNVGLARTSTGVKRIATSPEVFDAVAVREVAAEGRVVHVAHAGNYAPNGWSNANVQLLMANAAKWAARCQ